MLYAVYRVGKKVRWKSLKTGYASDLGFTRVRSVSKTFMQSFSLLTQKSTDTPARNVRR